MSRQAMDVQQGLEFLNVNGSQQAAQAIAEIVAQQNGASERLVNSAHFGRLMERYGVVGNGTSDDASSLQEAILAAGASNYEIAFPPEIRRLKINSGIQIVWPLVASDFHGLIIDASGMTSGRAITLTGTGVAPNNRYSNTCPLRRLRLLGPDTNDTAVDGICITGTEGGGTGLVPGHGAIEDIYVEGFRDNISLGPNFYISQFRNVFARKAKRANARFWGATNAGESINFFGGSLSDAANAGGTALGLLVEASGAEADLNFFGTSLSYNDKAFDIQGSSANFHSAHFENKTGAPMGSCSYTSGRPGTVVTLHGGSVTHGPLGSGTEATGGRPVMFEVSGDRTVFAARGVRYDGFARHLTEFVKVLSGSPLVSVENINGVSQANNATTGTLLGRISGYTSLIRNGDFALGNANYWTSGLGAAATVDAVNPNTAAGGLGSANSLKITGSTSTGSVGQNVQVAPGKKLRVRAFATVESVSAGSVFLRARFFSDSGTLISTSGSDIASASAVRAWLMYGGDFVVPAGARYATVDVYVSGFTGVARVADVEAWLI